MSEGVKEACGIIGIYGHKNAAYLTYLGLQAIQHRGQESCGIVSSDGNNFYDRLRMGLVAPNFKKENFPGTNGNGETLEGHIAIGHTRYSTTGALHIKNIQPLILDIKYGKVALGHNGNITNALTLREELKERGADFKTTTDSEVIGHLISFSKQKTLEGAIIDALRQLEGAYTVVIMSKDTLYAARDPNGFRPLSIGYLNKAAVIASESCALDVINAELKQDVQPGEIIIVDKKTIQQQNKFQQQLFAPKQFIQPSFCLFELIYFARPDSVINGIPVAAVRMELGRQAAREHPVHADFVCPVPDSGLYAAIGYAHESGIPFLPAYVRNHYVHRTFIDPDKEQRKLQVNLKLNPIKKFIKGMKIVVVDDSIVRGNTSRNRVAEFRECGAKEVHMRVSCPPHKHPCYYGIDFPDPQQLIANKYSQEKLRQFLKADSLGYVSMKGAIEAADRIAKGFCTACWTGKYPTPITDKNIGQKC